MVIKIYFSNDYSRTQISSDFYQTQIIGALFLKSIFEEYNSLESIRESQQPIDLKIYLTYNNLRETFEKIKADFLAIFPYLEDLRVKLSTDEESWNAFFPSKTEKFILEKIIKQYQRFLVILVS